MYKHRKLSFPRRSGSATAFHNLLAVFGTKWWIKRRFYYTCNGTQLEVAHGRLKCDDVRPIVSPNVSSRLASAPVSPTYVMFVDLSCRVVTTIQRVLKRFPVKGAQRHGLC